MAHYDDNNVADEFIDIYYKNFWIHQCLDYLIPISAIRPISAIIAKIIIITTILATMITTEQKTKIKPEFTEKQKNKPSETIAQRSFPHGEENTANKMKSKSMTSKHGRANSSGPLTIYAGSLNYKNNYYTKLTYNNSNDSNASDNSSGSNNSSSISTTSNININMSKNTNNNGINSYSSYKNTNRINSNLSQNNNNSDIPKIYRSKSQYTSTSFGLSGGGDFNFNMRRSIEVHLVISKSVTGTSGSNRDSDNMRKHKQLREKRAKSLTRLQEDILSMNMKNIFQTLETERQCIDEKAKETFNAKQISLGVEKEGIAIKDSNGWLKEEIINELRKNVQPMPKPHSWSSGSNLKYHTKHTGVPSVPLTKLSLRGRPRATALTITSQMIVMQQTHHGICLAHARTPQNKAKQAYAYNRHTKSRPSIIDSDDDEFENYESDEQVDKNDQIIKIIKIINIIRMR